MTSEGVNIPRFEEVHIYDSVAEPNELKKIICNDIFLLGGQFAILCQWAHPGLAIGSYRHSNFSSRMMRRLQNTSRFLNASVYGTAEERKAIAYVIHRYHSTVKGDTYDADDPELHKWTAATLFVAIIVVHEAFFGKLSAEKMEQLFKESAVYGTGLRMTPDMWPESLDEFWAYWNHNIENLEVTPEAKSLCTDLLYPRDLPLILQLTTPLARIMTIQWLPERLRREYGLTNSSVSQTTYGIAVTGLSLVYPLLPAWLRENWHRKYMKDLKVAVQKIKQSGHWSV